MTIERTQSRSRSRVASAMLVVAMVFGMVLTYPYLGLSMDDSRIGVQGEAQYTSLVVHIFTAAIALILGPLQFIPRVRRHRFAHRVIGRTYLLAGVLPSAIVGIPVAVWSGRLITQIGLSVAFALWIVTGVLAYRAARRRDIASHEAWMMRNYALTFLAVTARVLVPLLLLTQALLTGSEVSAVRELAPEMIPVGQILGWIVNLAVVEVLIRRRSTSSSPRRR